MFFPLVFSSVLVVCVAAASEFQQRCLAFKPHELISGATVDILSYVPANTTLTFPDNDASCNRKTQIVSADVCRMALSIKTSEHSSIIFEAWFPETWTGRFLATGNGGIDGCQYILSRRRMALIDHD
jgi:feruloyl esterase